MVHLLFLALTVCAVYLTRYTTRMVVRQKKYARFFNFLSSSGMLFFMFFLMHCFSVSSQISLLVIAVSIAIIAFFTELFYQNKLKEHDPQKISDQITVDLSQEQQMSLYMQKESESRKNLAYRCWWEHFLLQFCISCGILIVTVLVV